MEQRAVSFHAFKPRPQSRDDRDHGPIFMNSFESKHMIGQLSFDVRARISAAGEKSRGSAANARARAMIACFTRPSRQCVKQFGRAKVGLQRSLPRRIVDRTAVVGIDEGEIPELGALVEVGHARAGQREQSLREAVQRAGRGDAARRRRRFRSPSGGAVGSRCCVTRNSRQAASYSVFGTAHSVRRLASRSDFSCHRRDPVAERRPRRRGPRATGRAARRRPGSGRAWTSSAGSGAGCRPPPGATAR